MKKFNIAGACIKEKHYMVDTSNKIKKIEMMIEDEAYFTINRSRQFGKTTTLSVLAKYLKDKYVILKTSFEPTGESLFKDEETFCSNIFKIIAKDFEYVNEEFYNKILSYGEGIKSYDELSRKITKMSMDFNKPIVLLIDEVDQASNNAVFLKFLGVLRSKYMDRNTIPTFKSVILAGVHDIKSLKLLISEQKVITSDEAKEIASDRYNSPWNIASDFEVDMTFNPEEIATILEEYEKQNHTGMDINKISEEIYKYTSGYPFLVSKICKVIDEKLQIESDSWTIQGIEQAVNVILKEKSTLFESIIKNLENNEKMYSLIEKILVYGEEMDYNVDDPITDRAITYSIIKKGKKEAAVIHNRIFEIRIYNYMITKRKVEQEIRINYESRNQFIDQAGELNMVKILDKFQELMKEEYRKETEKFKEKEGRMIFLAFMKPIINGTGFYFIEAETRTNKRMDIVITYNKKMYIIELKKWHGKSYEDKGYNQLAGYMKIKDADEGYMVVFDFSKEKNYKNEWIKIGDRSIYEVVV